MCVFLCFIDNFYDVKYYEVVCNLEFFSQGPQGFETL